MVLAHNIKEGERTQDVQISEDVTFDSMLLKPNTLEGLTSSGFYKPSPIQLHGIPLGKCGFDIFLEAKSGTGKTAVFTIIALEKIDLEKDLQAIILAPTREIAVQISDVIKQIGCSYENLNVVTVIGGLSTNEDIEKFKKKVHIVVGSPGRLRHLIQFKYINVSAVRLFVMDEADKLMDKTFQADINYIFTVLPQEKQVIMSSATYPDQLKNLMNKYVRNAQHICPDSTSVLLGIKQLVTTVQFNSNIVRQTQHKYEELLKILSKKQFKQCLIFCNYQVRVKELCKMLTRDKWPAEQLHAQQAQSDRLDALRMLQEYQCRILISTDLAARGIDASNVDLVINFEPPHEWQTYLHRIGRAGRFGLYGTAVTILSEGQEENKFKRMICTICDSLHLKNLWDDEEKRDLITKDNIELPISPDTDNSNAYIELLNGLNDGTVKCDGESKIIDNLLDPVPPKESKIESFDDLLSCFESFKMNNNDYPKHQLNKEFNGVPIIAQLNETTNELPIFFTINELEDNLINVKEKDNLSNESLNAEKTEEKSKIVNVAILTNHEHDNIDIDPLSDFETKETLMHKALLDAGLPTSFSSSKANKNNSNKVCFTQNKNKNRQHVSQEAFKIDKKVEVPPLTKTKKFKESKRKVSSDFSNVQNDSKANPNENSFTQSDINYEINCNNQAENEIKYAMWFNHLKIRIEQMHLSLYIEELSKL